MTLDSSLNTSLFCKVFCISSYVYFFFVFLWLCLFLMPSQVLPESLLKLIPHTLDSAPTWESVEAAMSLDFLLLANFAILHSVLARPRVKSWMGFNQGFQRPFYVLQTTVCLHIQMYFWRNFKGTVWDATNSEFSKIVLTAGYLFGVLFLLSATFALDHFHLFGLSQGLGLDINAMTGLAPKKAEGSEIVTRWHYRYVAHPIMTGILTMFWSTPDMTAPRFLLALVNTLYIMIAVLHFEEKDLATEMGPAYEKYLKNVPRFIPGFPLGRSRTPEEVPVSSVGNDDGMKKSTYS